MLGNHEPPHPPCSRLISLTSWTLQLCPAGAAVMAMDGPQQLPALPPMPDVSVSVSRSGISVNISNNTTPGNDTAETAETRVASMEGHAQNLLHLLFPGATDYQPGGCHIQLSSTPSSFPLISLPAAARSDLLATAFHCACMAHVSVIPLWYAVSHTYTVCCV